MNALQFWVRELDVESLKEEVSQVSQEGEGGMERGGGEKKTGEGREPRVDKSG